MSSSGKSTADVVIGDLGKAVEIISTIASFTPLGGAVMGGLTVAKLLMIATGVAKQAPEFLAIFNSMRSLAAQHTAPTPAQWEEWDKAADDAYGVVQADLKKLEDGS